MLMEYMKFTNKRQVALIICQAVTKATAILDNGETVDQLLTFIMSLLVDDPAGKEEAFEFDEG